jgi:hypothetical protein
MPSYSTVIVMLPCLSSCTCITAFPLLNILRKRNPYYSQYLLHFMLEWSPYNAYAITEAMGRIFIHTNIKKETDLTKLQVSE